MPKLKTKRTLAKRVKLTKHGKILRRRTGKSHLLTGMTRKRKRMLRRSATMGKTETKTLTKLLIV